jgi:anti-sigma-K factor RskA
MAEEHVLDLIPAYALGCLEVDDRQKVSTHLKACDRCTQELQIYQAVVEKLPMASPDRQPPPRLRGLIVHRAASQRYQNRTAAEKSRWRLGDFLKPFRTAWGAAALALVIILAAGNILLWQQVQRLQTAAQQVHLVQMNGTQITPGASAVLVIGSGGEIGTLVVYGLPELSQTHQYQLWLIYDGKRTSGGVFSVGKNGEATLKLTSEVSLYTYTAFGVTIEPSGGSPGPTGEKVLGGNF